MSSSSGSDSAPTIHLSDDRETVFEKIHTHAYSGGGRSTIEAHRKEGGDPEADVSFRLLHSFFEENDDRLEQLARDYRNGSLLSGELKELAADAIASFLDAHQRRRRQLQPLETELQRYQLTQRERENAQHRVGHTTFKTMI